MASNKEPSTWRGKIRKISSGDGRKRSGLYNKKR